MKKVLLVSSCVALLASSSFAEGFFIGGEGGWLNSKMKLTSKGKITTYTTDTFIPQETTSFENTEKHTRNGANVSLKAGYVFTDNHRIYAAYGYNFGFNFNTDNTNLNVNSHKILLGYDFTPQIYDSWRGVLGLYGGYSLFKMSGNNLYKDLRSANGFAYGAKIGALYEVNEHNEIEFGFKAEQLLHSKDVNMEDSDTMMPITSSGTFKPTATNLGLYVGYTYKF